MKVRSVFLSDIHLGTRACQAKKLLDFLREYESEHLYLIGDIVDFWAMSRSVNWTAAQNTVVQKILRRARHGEKVFFIPGNHDEVLRGYIGISFGNVHIVDDMIHETADGRHLLLLHGDAFDQITRYHRWIAILGDIGYGFLVKLNNLLSRVRRALRMPGYWSLAGYAKRRVKTAVTFIFNFEDAVTRYVRERGLDGVVCGHIHSACTRELNGVLYINCGDWVDSCTAIVEHLDGRIELIDWHITGGAIGNGTAEIAAEGSAGSATENTVVPLRSMAR